MSGIGHPALSSSKVGDALLHGVFGLADADLGLALQRLSHTICLHLVGTECGGDLLSGLADGLVDVDCCLSAMLPM